MKGLFAVALIAVAASVGCDSPVAPTTVSGSTLTVQRAPFRNFGDYVPDPPQDTCAVRSGCCFNRRPHWHCW